MAMRLIIGAILPCTLGFTGCMQFTEAVPNPPSESFAVLSAAMFATLLAFLLVEAYRTRQRHLDRHATNHAKARNDQQSYALILRSFTESYAYETWVTTEHASHDGIGLPTPHVQRSNIAELDSALKAIGTTLVAVGSQFDLPEDHGMVIIEASPECWFKDVEWLAAGAQVIFFFPATTPSILREMDLLRSQGLLNRVVLIMPPRQVDAVTDHEASGTSQWKHGDESEGWQAFRRRVQGTFDLPDYSSAGGLLLLHEDKELTLWVDRRDSDSKTLSEALGAIWPKLSRNTRSLATAYRGLSTPEPRRLRRLLTDEAPSRTRGFHITWGTCMSLVFGVWMMWALASWFDFTSTIFLENSWLLFSVGGMGALVLTLVTSMGMLFVREVGAAALTLVDRPLLDP